MCLEAKRLIEKGLVEALWTALEKDKESVKKQQDELKEGLVLYVHGMEYVIESAKHEQWSSSLVLRRVKKK